MTEIFYLFFPLLDSIMVFFDDHSFKLTNCNCKMMLSLYLIILDTIVHKLLTFLVSFNIFIHWFYFKMYFWNVWKKNFKWFIKFVSFKKKKKYYSWKKKHTYFWQWFRIKFFIFPLAFETKYSAIFLYSKNILQLLLKHSRTKVDKSLLNTFNCLFMSLT